VHDRKCKLCKTDIEDECHFLLQCPKLERKEFLELISKEYKNFINLDFNNKFIWLMSSEDDFVIQHLYKLLCNLNIKKQSILADGVLAMPLQQIIWGHCAYYYVYYCLFNFVAISNL
jgi:hypothetical protein